MVRNFIKNILDKSVIQGVGDRTFTVSTLDYFIRFNLINSLNDSNKKQLTYVLSADDYFIGNGIIPISNIEYEYCLLRINEIQQEQTLKLIRHFDSEYGN